MENIRKIWSLSLNNENYIKKVGTDRREKREERENDSIEKLNNPNKLISTTSNSTIHKNETKGPIVEKSQSNDPNMVSNDSKDVLLSHYYKDNIIPNNINKLNNAQLKNLAYSYISKDDNIKYTLLWSPLSSYISIPVNKCIDKIEKKDEVSVPILSKISANAPENCKIGIEHEKSRIIKKRLDIIRSESDSFNRSLLKPIGLEKEENDNMEDNNEDEEDINSNSESEFNFEDKEIIENIPIDKVAGIKKTSPSNLLKRLQNKNVTTKSKFTFPMELFRAKEKVEVTSEFKTRPFESLFENTKVLNKFKTFNGENNLSPTTSPNKISNIETPNKNLKLSARGEHRTDYPIKLTQTPKLPLIPKLPIEKINYEEEDRINKIISSSHSYQPLIIPGRNPNNSSMLLKSVRMKKYKKFEPTIILSEPGPADYNLPEDKRSGVSFSVTERDILKENHKKLTEDWPDFGELKSPKSHEYSFGNSRRFNNEIIISEHNPAPGAYNIAPKLNSRGALPFASSKTQPRGTSNSDSTNKGPGYYSTNDNVLSSNKKPATYRFPLESRFYFKPTVPADSEKVAVNSAKRRQTDFAKKVGNLTRENRLKKIRENAEVTSTKIRSAALQKEIRYIRLRQAHNEVVARYDYQLAKTHKRRHDPIALAVERWLCLCNIAKFNRIIGTKIMENRNLVGENKRILQMERDNYAYIMSFLGTRVVKLQSNCVLIIWRWYCRWKKRWRNKKIDLIKLALTKRKQLAFLFEVNRRVKTRAAIKIQRRYRSNLEVRAARMFLQLQQWLLFESYLLFFIKQYLHFPANAKVLELLPFEMPNRLLPSFLPLHNALDSFIMKYLPLSMRKYYFTNRYPNLIAQISSISKIVNNARASFCKNEIEHNSNVNLSVKIPASKINSQNKKHSFADNNNTSTQGSFSNISPITPSTDDNPIISTDFPAINNIAPPQIISDLLMDLGFERVPFDIREVIVRDELMNRRNIYKASKALYNRKKAMFELTNLLSVEESNLYSNKIANPTGCTPSNRIKRASKASFKVSNKLALNASKNIETLAKNNMKAPFLSLIYTTDDLIRLFEVAYAKYNVSESFMILLKKIFAWMRINFPTNMPNPSTSSSLGQFILLLALEQEANKLNSPKAPQFSKIMSQTYNFPSTFKLPAAFATFVEQGKPKEEVHKFKKMIRIT